MKRHRKFNKPRGGVSPNLHLILPLGTRPLTGVGWASSGSPIHYTW